MIPGLRVQGLLFWIGLGLGFVGVPVRVFCWTLGFCKEDDSGVQGPLKFRGHGFAKGWGGALGIESFGLRGKGLRNAQGVPLKISYVLQVLYR